MTPVLKFVQQALKDRTGLRGPNEDAYEIFSALRGPDIPDCLDAKRATTAVLRLACGFSYSDAYLTVERDCSYFVEIRKAFRHPQMGSEGRMIMVVDHGGFKTELIWPGYHFIQHQERAFLAAGLKWDELNEFEAS